MFVPRITDEMREHMFDNWSEKKLQSMADDEHWTIPELKERLLEFAAFHGFDTLGYGNNGNNVNSVSQFDGAPMECDTFNVEPQTPTMTSPMSQNSNNCESVFDSGASVFTTPSSQFTPAKVKVDDNGSPVKQRDTKYAQLHQADGSSSDFVQPLDCYTSTIHTNDQPIARIFDSEKRIKHRSVPMDLRVAYNPDKSVLHLQGVDPSTGNLQADPSTLVISIDGVVYEDDDGQAGAAVFFHPLSPWNTVTCVKKTKDNAKLEALYVVLNMISFTAANDPNLKAVYIMCTGRDFCLANTVGNYNLADRQAVGEWLEGADKTTLAEINELWTDITKGINGHRAVDVRLWCVSEEMIRPVTEVATAYLYKQHGRDWYAENGKAREHFVVDSPNTPAYQRDYSIVSPQYIVDLGPQAVTKWTAEANARFKQSVLHKLVASNGCRQLNDQLRASEELMSTERFLDTYAMATKYMSEDPQKHLDQFVAEQQAIRQGSQFRDQRMNNGGTGSGEDGETGGEDQKLVQQVLDMDWE